MRDPWNASDYHLANEEILMAAQDNMNLETGGVKFDAGKIRMDLNPPDALAAIAAVFTYGAIKYDDWNWAKGMRTGRLMAAMQRHQAAYMLGEERDEESGLPHLWHMGCCALMLIAGDLRRVLEDDRPSTPWEFTDVDGSTEESAAWQFINTVFNEDMNDPTGTAVNAGGAIVDEPPTIMPPEGFDLLGALKEAADDMGEKEPPMSREEVFDMLREMAGTGTTARTAWRQHVHDTFLDVGLYEMVNDDRLDNTEIILGEAPEELSEEEAHRIVQEVATAHLAGVYN